MYRILSSFELDLPQICTHAAGYVHTAVAGAMKGGSCRSSRMLFSAFRINTPGAQDVRVGPELPFWGGCTHQIINASLVS